MLEEDLYIVLNKETDEILYEGSWTDCVQYRLAWGYTSDDTRIIKGPI